MMIIMAMMKKVISTCVTIISTYSSNTTMIIAIDMPRPIRSCAGPTPPATQRTPQA